MTRRTPGFEIDGQPTKVDPRDFPDPLTVPEPEQDTGYRRTGCSIFTLAAFAVGLAFWLAVVLVVSAVAAPRGEAQTGYADLHQPGQSGVSELHPGAPHERPFVIQVDARHDGGAPPLTPEVLAGGTTYSGRLAWADPKYGPRYLALREPRGTRVLVCGPADCVEMTSNDYGPVYSLWKQGRIADVAVAAWERICGVPRRFGLCPGSIQILRRPQIALPATSTEEEGP